MAVRGFPPRPGEPAPGEIGKGGDVPDQERPIDEPTDLPERKPGPKKGPIPQPTM
jgi:hypothetical protein